MDKKKKIMFIVLLVILIVLCVIGVLSFVSYSKSKPQKNTDFEEVEIDENSGEPYAYGLDITTSEEFINAINEQYYNGEKKAKLTNEVDGCFKATGSDGVKYSYCVGAIDISIEG